MTAGIIWKLNDKLRCLRQCHCSYCLKILIETLQLILLYQEVDLSALERNARSFAAIEPSLIEVRSVVRKHKILIKASYNKSIGKLMLNPCLSLTATYPASLSSCEQLMVAMTHSRPIMNFHKRKSRNSNLSADVAIRSCTQPCYNFQTIILF